MVRLIIKVTLAATLYISASEAYGVVTQGQQNQEEATSLTTIAAARASADVQIRRIKASMATNIGDTDKDMERLEALQSQLDGAK